MTEDTRKEIIKKINIDKNKIAYKTILEQMIKEQSNNIEVKKYLTLLNEYQNILKEQKYFDNSEKKIIDFEFMWALEENKHNKNNCNHDIWLYDKSYYLKIDTWGEKYIPCENEDHKRFAYNSYVCLECGKEIKVIDWTEFEKTNQVLKNQSKKTNPGVHRYRMLYFESLYRHNIEEAREILINRFNQDKEKELTRIKK